MIPTRALVLVHKLYKIQQGLRHPTTTPPKNPIKYKTWSMCVKFTCLLYWYNFYPLGIKKLSCNICTILTQVFVTMIQWPMSEKDKKRYDEKDKKYYFCGQHLTPRSDMVMVHLTKKYENVGRRVYTPNSSQTV